MGPVMGVCMEVMDRPWQWGAADCCTAACDVFLRLYGIDPMTPLRGRYSSRVGALRMIAQEGGWLKMTDSLAARSGLVHVPSEDPGNIGIVRTAEGDLALGICVSPSVWVGKSERGLATVPKVLRIWRIA